MYFFFCGEIKLFNSSEAPNYTNQEQGPVGIGWSNDR